MSVLDTEPTVDTTDGEERDRQKHYVKHDALEAAMLHGVPAKALCGKLWLPGRDPSKYPLCKTCEKIFKSLPKGT